MGWSTTVNDYHANDLEGSGKIRVEGGKTFKWVKNVTGGALFVGGVYFYGGTAGDISLTSIFKLGQAGEDTASSLEAGVSMSVAGANSYCWIQIGGPGRVLLQTDGSTVISIGMVCDPVSGQVYLTNGSAAGVASLTTRVIISLVAVPVDITSTIKDCLIQCL